MELLKSGRSNIMLITRRLPGFSLIRSRTMNPPWQVFGVLKIRKEDYEPAKLFSGVNRRFHKPQDNNMVDHMTIYISTLCSYELLKLDQAKNSCEPLMSVAPIVWSLLKLNAQSCECLSRKFDLSFTIAKEEIPFAKYSSLCQLEKRHAVDMGTSYNNNVSCKNFTHFIAQSQRLLFITFLKEKVTYFSFLMDNTTDIAKDEDEAVVLLYCQQDDHGREIKPCTRFLSEGTVYKTNADGLLKCLSKILLNTLGIENICDRSNFLGCNLILVRGGTDGASVNIAQHSSIKANLCHSLPWIYWSWCSLTI